MYIMKIWIHYHKKESLLTFMIFYSYYYHYEIYFHRNMSDSGVKMGIWCVSFHFLPKDIFKLH